MSGVAENILQLFIIPNDNYLNYIDYIYQDKYELNLASRVSRDWGRASSGVFGIRVVKPLVLKLCVKDLLGQGGCCNEYTGLLVSTLNLRETQQHLTSVELHIHN